MNTSLKLGRNQKAILRAMQRRHDTYSEGCGWVWDTHRGTVRLLDTLVKHGLVETVDRRGVTVYRLTDAGRSYGPVD